MSGGPYACCSLRKLRSLSARSSLTQQTNSRSPAAFDTLSMTGRGANGPPPSRPTNPPDPTLLTRPVPRKRTFPIRSFGPGAALDASTTDPSRCKARAQEAWWDDFNRAAGPLEYDERENCAVLRAIRGSEAVVWRDDGVLVPQRVGDSTSS